MNHALSTAARTGACPPPLLALMVLALCCGLTRPVRAVTSREVLELFAAPTAEYSTAPLWVWNDRLTGEQVRGSLRDLASQKVLQVFVHPRPGLMTPYLSPEWFRLWKIALDEARTLGMKVWIYDENSYPSGFAGGLVMEALPEARGRGLVIEELESAPTWNDAILGVYRLTDDGFETVTGDLRDGRSLPAGRHAVARVVRAPDSPWHGGKSYVDLLYPGVTEKFLEITLGAYRREVGEAFGRRIPGIFTDEPHLRPAGGLPWTEDLPAVFEARRGYPLLDRLPGLTRPAGDWKQVRYDYFRTLLELFIERWARPYHDACEREGLELTGHYWEHEWPRCLLVPDNMAMYAWHQRPAIDILMNRYDEGLNAQFGSLRSVRELSSVASQLGRRRTLCEAYGAAGWELRFQDMKRIADWLLVLGVNTLDEHLSFITLRGARKADHPQSFSPHEPWWESYHVRATYATRLSAVLSQGDQIQPFVVLEPTTTAWLYQADPGHAEHLREIGRRFEELLRGLERAQVEYDLGCEDIIARHGSVRVRRLKIGRRGYRAVILPPLLENLGARTAELLEELTLTGGTVLFCGELPGLVDGRPATPSGVSPGTLPVGWQRVSPGELPAILDGLTSDGFAIRRTPDDAGILHHHRRRLDDGELLFLVNTSETAVSSGTVISPARGVERWDMETGTAGPAVFRKTPGGVELPFELPPCGSLLVFLSWQPLDPAPAPDLVTGTIPASGPPEVERLEHNVLTIDYVDVSVGVESLDRVHVSRAAEFAFRSNGLDRHPWDRSVQFRDELVSRVFPPGSGVEVTYRFTIEEEVPEALSVVVERPDLYDVRLNGVELSARPGSWWLDRSLGKLEAQAAARVGENTLELSASPFSVHHEIEAAYVIGEFGVRAAESGFVIVPEQALAVRSWKEQLLPLYGAGVAYRSSFELPVTSGEYRVRLPSWNGSVARLRVNGRVAGIVEAPPYTRDVTPLVKAGRNTIEVVVIGTLKNTLGPHHAGPGLGLAGPGRFRNGPAQGPPPGRDYATVDYGLFEPFVLEQSTGRQ